jgi:hypothetical protein
MWLRGSRELGYTPCDQNDDGCVPYDDDRLSLFGDDRDDAQMLPGQHDLDTVLQQADDATWILSSAFMILTMQSGFSMRKCVHYKICCESSNGLSQSVSQSVSQSERRRTFSLNKQHLSLSFVWVFIVCFSLLVVVYFFLPLTAARPQSKKGTCPLSTA